MWGSTRRNAGGALIAGLLFLGCKDVGSPVSHEHHLSGQVRLVSNLFDLSGNPLGTRNVDDAEGVLVYLEGAAGTLDSTRTSAGRYEFHVSTAGRYRVSSWVVRSHTVTTSEVAAGDADVTNPDTLLIGPFGDMRTSPNPAEPEGLGLEFTAAVPGRYRVEILSPAREIVWSYADSTIGGFNHVHWDGDDLTEHVVAKGAYWAIVHHDGLDAYNLVFWDHGHEPPTPGNCGHVEAEGYFLEEHGNVLVTNWHGVQQGGIQTTVHGLAHGVHLSFLAADSTAFAVADTCPQNHMTWSVADSTVVSIEQEHWAVNVYGLKAGSTTLVLNAWHEGHIHLSTLPIPITVTPVGKPSSGPKPAVRPPRSRTSRNPG